MMPLVQTKTYLMADTEPPALEKVVGTEISWASGKDPTKKVRDARPLPWPSLSERRAALCSKRMGQVGSIFPCHPDQAATLN